MIAASTTAHFRSVGICLLAIMVLMASGCVREQDKLNQIMRPTGGAPTVPAKPVEPVAAKPETASNAGPGTGWYRPRSSWAGQGIDRSNVEPMAPIWRITIHHSGDANDAAGEPAAHLREFERAHKGKGWACIGYHFVIARNGTVYEARPLDYQGAHAVGDNNIGNIGVCLMGNFEDRPVPPAQLKALQATIDRLRATYGIKRKDVYGHHDFKTTECPGRYLSRWIERYKTSTD